MTEKNLLILETQEANAAKFSEFLKDTSWTLTITGDLNTFAELFGDGNYELVIIEEKAASPDVVKMLAGIGTPIIISTDSGKKTEGTFSISRNFTRSELTNIIGKVSFGRVMSNPELNAEGGEEPVVLEPVFESEDEAMVLSPENVSGEQKSTFETGGKKGGKDIFDRIDEIDSIMMSLTKDISEKKPSKPVEKTAGKPIEKPVEKPMEKPVPKSKKLEWKDEISDKTEPIEFTPKKDGAGNEADFLFDDSYRYAEKKEKSEDEAEKPKFEHFQGDSGDSDRESIIRDFESIISDKMVKKAPEPEEKKDTSSLSDLNARSEKMLKSEEKKRADAGEPDSVIENNSIYDDDIPQNKPENGNVPSEYDIRESAGPVSVETVPPEPVGTAGSDDNAVKAEVRDWLEKNARKIIKEVIEEHLARFAGK